MPTLTVEQKYAQPAVIDFWQQLARQGLQQAELEMVRRYLPPPGPLLDLGCGAGRAGLALASYGYTVTGIDVSRPMLHAGREISAGARLCAANLRRLPFFDRSFSGAVMFFGALQHLPGRDIRQETLAEISRVIGPGGRLVVGLDNLAPALTLYAYWLHRRLTAAPAATPSSPPAADAVLWNRRGGAVGWHLRGVVRTLRWRTWPGLIDLLRYTFPLAEPGEVRVSQFSMPPTPGKVDYHLYRAGEMIEDAASAGWYLQTYRAGRELSERTTYPAYIRGLDKQLFFVFQKA
jgi:SAM-dependent methyltransferase